MALAELIEISHYAGRHPEWVQGGGGNCSVKEGTFMWIKASGFNLEELTESQGHVKVLLETGKPEPEEKLRASLETPLHLCLGRTVIHTHPIALNVLLCSYEGNEKIQKLFSEHNCLWIEYTNPGQKLFENVKKKLHAFDLNQPLILFLENHGLFVSAQTAETAKSLHSQVIEKVKAFVQSISEKTLVEWKTPEQYFTPDHAVFFNLDKVSGKNIQALKELQLSHVQIDSGIRNNHLTPKYLSTANVAELLNMEEEKYRQRLGNQA